MRSRLFLVSLAVAFGAAIGPLAAHSEVFERAPESGQVVGGVVDHIDISFWVPVSSGNIGLLGPDEAPIEVGPTSLSANGRIVSVEFEPLEQAGNYIVTHTELSEDGDTQTDAFAFVFDPESDRELASLISRDSGPNWLLLGGVGGLILVLAGLFWPGRSAKKV